MYTLRLTPTPNHRKYFKPYQVYVNFKICDFLSLQNTEVVKWQEH